ncbi:MAG: hypothetical protein QOG14_1873 [Mycobacterium sp.]|jgi:hypothetical protein|nr:hypothetical protein [Mycobacterium sp.]
MSSLAMKPSMAVFTRLKHSDNHFQSSRSRSIGASSDLAQTTTAWREATTLESGVAAAARVEPTPAKIRPTEPAEIEIATGVVTSAGVVAGEAYVATA